MGLPQIPLLRHGMPYSSLDVTQPTDHRTGESVAQLSLANAGLIRKDARRQADAQAALAAFSCEALCDIAMRAADVFMSAELPLGETTQSPQDYIEQLSATSGLPHVLVRANMGKLEGALRNMPLLLRGLSRGLDPSVIDSGFGEQAGVAVSFFPSTRALGVVLPSNSPGVNSLWLPALPLKTPVALRPGREEPWTPYRLIQAFIAAGCPPEAFCFYPSSHDGAQAVLETCGRALLFGGDDTVRPYVNNPAVQIHGAGRSKVLLGADGAENWREHLDVLAASVCDNGGRSCINASCIVTPEYADEIGEALAQRLAAMEARAMDDPQACLAAFANPAVARAIDQQIELGLREAGAEDLTARYRSGPRLVEVAGSSFLLPTVVRCDDIDHPLANREFLFPYCAVVRVPTAEMTTRIGPTLAASAITGDAALRRALIGCADIDRLNLGPVPTSAVRWEQPHEGNLFEFLYRRRAIQHAEATV